MGYIYAKTGRPAEAQKLVDELKNRSTRRYVSPYHFAVIYAGLGEKDLAFEWLKRAYEDQSMFVTFIPTTPEFDNLRSDSRYRDLLRLLNLPPYNHS